MNLYPNSRVSRVTQQYCLDSECVHTPDVAATVAWSLIAPRGEGITEEEYKGNSCMQTFLDIFLLGVLGNN